MILPILDYCSQLWSPLKKGQINDLESLQRSFTSKIDGLRNMDYWQRLDYLHLYSLQRRRERYQIIYVWKAIEHLVPNQFNVNMNARRGRSVAIPDYRNLNNTKVQSLRDSSFQMRGPSLFNRMPASVRNTTNCSVDVFKNCLDRFLSSIPDEPLVQGYTAFNRYRSNSLLDVCRSN